MEDDDDLAKLDHEPTLLILTSFICGVFVIFWSSFFKFSKLPLEGNDDGVEVTSGLDCRSTDSPKSGVPERDVVSLSFSSPMVNLTGEWGFSLDPLLLLVFCGTVAMGADSFTAAVTGCSALTFVNAAGFGV